MENIGKECSLCKEIASHRMTMVGVIRPELEMSLKSKAPRKVKKMIKNFNEDHIMHFWACDDCRTQYVSGSQCLNQSCQKELKDVIYFGVCLIFNDKIGIAYSYGYCSPKCKGQDNKNIGPRAQNHAGVKMEKMRECAYCGKIDSPGMKVCGRCRDYHYCNKECQSKDWKIHRPICQTYR